MSATTAFMVGWIWGMLVAFIVVQISRIWRMPSHRGRGLFMVDEDRKGNRVLSGMRESPREDV